MNQRIREFAEQAEIYIVPEPWDSASRSWNANMEKFAELIVKECADLCESFGESGDGYTCSAEILEHFGVER